MEEEHSEVEAENNNTPQTEKTTADSTEKSGKGLLIGGGIVVVLLLIIGLFVPPISLGERLSGGNASNETETAESTTAVPTEETTAEIVPEIAGEVAVTTSDPVNVTRLAAADLASAGIAELPANVVLQSNVYTVDSGETAVSGQVAVNVPAGVAASMSDLYGWNGTAWEFVPSTYDHASQQRISPEHNLHQAFALASTQAPEQFAIGGAWNEQPIAEDALSHLSELTAGTLTLEATGKLDGEIDTLPESVSTSYLRITNANDEVDTASLATFLGDSTAQTNQINALVNTAVSGNYTGINLDYQGIDAGQKELFTSYIQSLAAALDAQDKTLVVTLDTSTFGDGAGQDWAAIGAIADTIYLPLPLDPAAYLHDGDVDDLLASATSQIERSKIIALTHAAAIDQVGDTFVELTDEEAVANFGQLEFMTGGSEVEPETAVAVALSGNAGPLEWDGTNATYRYSYEDDNGESHIVWLSNPSATLNRLQTAVNHNLKGAAINNLDQVKNPAQFTAALNSLNGIGDAPEPTAATFVWTVLDEDETILATDSGHNMTFSWDGTADPGEYSVNVDFALGDTIIPLSSTPILVAEAEEEVAAESDENTETATSSSGIVATVNKNANVRVGPGVAYSKLEAILPKDAQVDILGRSEDANWFNIRFPDGEQEGWIFESLLDFDPELDVTTIAIIIGIPDIDDGTVANNNPAPTTPADTDAEPAPPSSGPPPPVSAAPVAVGGFELGGQTHSFSNPGLMSSAGMNWVKFQHKWGEGSNPNDLAGRINNAHGAGFKVLLSIPGANTYPESINFEEYVQFLGGVAALGPDAIEVWNEMNIDFEWPVGQIDPNSYVNNMLAPAYNAIKTANPNVMVVSGAPAPTGFDNNTNAWADNRYMAGMIAAGAANYMDCVGAHYNAGASSPSTTSGHPTGSAHYSWYLLPTLNVYAQLGRPVCFTELGYLSGADYGGVPERFGWAANTTVEQHAAWLAEAVSVAANTGKVRMIIVFNVDFTQWGDDPQAGYAMIRKNGGCPACDTLGQVMGR